MKTTKNYKLNKPDLNDTIDISILNSNSDIVDSVLQEIELSKIKGSEKGAANGVATLDSLGKIPSEQLPMTNSSKGVGNFAGSGNEVTIPHLLATVPSSAYVVALENPKGFLGELWIRYDNTNVYIGNSGSFTGKYAWIAYK